MFQIHEQRRVARHGDHVRIAFHSGHHGSLAERGAEIALACVLRHGVFADENLRAFAVILIPVR